MTTQMINIENHATSAYSHSGNKLILFSKKIRINIPGFSSLILWAYPSSLWIQRQDGSEDVIKIKDNTRKIIIALFGFSIAFLLLLLNKSIDIQKFKERSL